MDNLPFKDLSFDKHQNVEEFSYYEYKFLVSNQNLTAVRSVLEELCRDSDPFPSGVVDSIYYDTADEQLFQQCLDGEALKVKFRIRGYGDGNYNQVHQKFKNLSGVHKIKSPIELCQAPREIYPPWEELRALNPDDPGFLRIKFDGRRFGMLQPSIRVKYTRQRYRLYDYRFTLDSNIEVFSPGNGLPRTISHALLPHHVLEIKNTEVRPNLPFVGLIKLPQISFSKFMIGLNLLKCL